MTINNAPVSYETISGTLQYNENGTPATVPLTATNITGLIAAGTNCSFSGSGTSGSPYTVNATGGAGYANIIATSAVADCKFLTDGAVSSSSTSFTSASNPFVLGDTGKTICIAGAGAAGAVLTTTITYVSAGAVTLGTAASTTVSGATCHFGTDNTTAINSDISSLTKGGTVMFGTGYYLVSSINMTGTNSIALVGASQGINANDKGTVLVPKTSGNIIDCTGTGAPVIRNLQVGTTRSAQTADIGILLAQNNAGAFSSLVLLENVFVTGKYNVSSIYCYGVGDSMLRNCTFWNHIGTSKYAMIFTRDNVASVSSSYATIATGEQAIGNWLWDKFEAHDYKTSGATTGGAIRFRGLSQMKLMAGLIDSSSSLGNVTVETVGTTGCFRHNYDTCTFYAEGATAPAYSFNLANNYTDVTLTTCSFTFGTAQVGGSGTFVGSGGTGAPVVVAALSFSGISSMSTYNSYNITSYAKTAAGRYTVTPSVSYKYMSVIAGNSGNDIFSIAPYNTAYASTVGVMTCLGDRTPTDCQYITVLFFG